MRVTYHSSRANKNGVYLAKHNDRNFDLDNAEHIKKEYTKDNAYWHCFKKDFPDLTFEQAELKFYEEHFSDFLNARNEKYIKRHKDKIKTMSDYLKSRKTCPEEIIFQIGNEKEFWDKKNNLDPQKILDIYADFRKWRKEKFPNVKSLNVAIHVDEATPHIHERIVWIAHDDNGREMVHQAKALTEMQIPKFQTDKKENRYNNAKMVFTKLCREKFFAICRENGIEIEEKPLERSSVGLSLTEYKTRQEEQYFDELKDEIEKMEEEKKKLEQINKEISDTVKSNAFLFENFKKYFDEKNKKKFAETINKIYAIFGEYLPKWKIENRKNENVDIDLKNHDRGRVR